MDKVQDHKELQLQVILEHPTLVVVNQHVPEKVTVVMVVQSDLQVVQVQLLTEFLDHFRLKLIQTVVQVVQLDQQVLLDLQDQQDQLDQQDHRQTATLVKSQDYKPKYLQRAFNECPR